MDLPEMYQAQVDEFFAYVEAFAPAYSHATFNYAALRNGADFVLVSGRLFLNVVPNKVSHTHFTSENVRVGSFALGDVAKSPKELLDALLAGKISTPAGDFLFLRDEGRHTVFHTPFHQDGAQNHRRVAVLQIQGMRQMQFIRYDHLDWEIRAAATPFDGFQDLLYFHQLGRFASDAARMDFVANAVTEVDFSAKIEGTVAKPAILLAKGLDIKLARLGYRVFEKGQVVARGAIEGKDLEWTESDTALVGTGTVEIPKAAHFHCVASYDGVAQELGWIVEPTAGQNARRAAYETVDPKLENLRAMIQNTQERIRNARDFELVVSWLLWMLGFSPAHLGTHAATQDAADVIITTPAGHFVVVECTTGILKTQKLSQLFERTRALRSSLQASGNSHLRVLAAIVTTKARTELGEADIEFAEKQGILVYTRENLEEALTRTQFFPNADQSFVQAEQSQRTAYNNRNAQGTLPLDQ